MTTSIATHVSPVWRGDANFLIFADLTESGLEDRWEQLWAKQVADDEFILCCIPYFTYGMALGDRVRAGPSKGQKYVASAVVCRSGRRVLRLWLKRTTAEGRDRVAEYISAHAPQHEWSSENLLAIDVAGPNEIPSGLSQLLADAERLAIEVEWGE